MTAALVVVVVVVVVVDGAVVELAVTVMDVAVIVVELAVAVIVGVASTPGASSSSRHTQAIESTAVRTTFFSPTVVGVARPRAPRPRLRADCCWLHRDSSSSTPARRSGNTFHIR